MAASLRVNLPWFVAVSLLLALGAWLAARASLRHQENARTQKLAEERLRIRSAFEHAAIGMAIVSLDGQVMETNRYFCRMLGARPGNGPCGMTGPPTFVPKTKS